jgi:hypothetical protein
MTHTSFDVRKARLLLASRLDFASLNMSATTEAIARSDAKRHQHLGWRKHRDECLSMYLISHLQQHMPKPLVTAEKWGTSDTGSHPQMDFEI